MLKVRLVRSRASKVIPRGGRLLGQVEEYFIETMTPGDTFVFAGEVLKYEAIVEDEVYVSRSNDPDPKVPSYEGGKFPLSTYLADRVRSILADHRHLARAARSGARMAGGAGISLAPAGHARAAGRDVSARREVLPRLLSVRGPPRAPDARHAADAAARARAHAPARLRGERVCARGLGPARRGVRDRARRALARCAVRPGHARRRSRSLARRVRADEAHVPQLRDHRRADRAALSGRGEEPPPDDDLDRPRLRRAAQAPAGPSAAARGLCGRGVRPARHRAASARCSRACRGASPTIRSITSRRSRCR